MARHWPRVLRTANDENDEPITVDKRDKSSNLLASIASAFARVEAAKTEMRAAIIDLHESNVRLADYNQCQPGVIIDHYLPELEFPDFLKTTEEIEASKGTPQ